MQNNLNDTRQSNLRTSSSNSSIITDEIDCLTKSTCLTDGFRRKKSASLNSPANSGRKNLFEKKKFFLFYFIN